MKYLLSLGIFSLLMLASFTSCAQKDKSKRPSPPALVTQKVGETTVSIDYSQPSVKGRTIGKDLEPIPGQVWRTGANEATVFEVDKDVAVEGKALPKGKYALFTIQNGDDWTIIFNKTWNQWGAFKYNQADDVLRVNVKGKKTEAVAEKMTFTISQAGMVTLLWGNLQVDFAVK